jgi:hypothetical protein
MTPIQKAIEAFDLLTRMCVTHPEYNDTCHGVFEAARVNANLALAALRAVNETHVMAPKEPSDEMCNAGWKEFDKGWGAATVYKAMIAEAQKEG